jgi:hypothetical protein
MAYGPIPSSLDDGLILRFGLLVWPDASGD